MRTLGAFIAVIATACGNGGDPPSSSARGSAVQAGGETIAVPGGKGAGGISGTQRTGSNPAFQLRPDEGTLTIASAESAAGSVATAMVTVTPAAGFHVSTEFNIKLALEPTAGITFEKAVLTAGGRRKLQGDAQTFSEKELAFAVHATAATPGRYEIKGTFDFGVCEGERCHMKNQPITIVVAAK